MEMTEKDTQNRGQREAQMPRDRKKTERERERQSGTERKIAINIHMWTLDQGQTQQGDWTLST
jgi:hypothetical protein